MKKWVARIILVVLGMLAVVPMVAVFVKQFPAWIQVIGALELYISAGVAVITAGVFIVDGIARLVRIAKGE